MTKRRRFMQVDVFGSGPLSGNPLAVVLDGDGLDSAQMQAFARWMNLSETTFLLPPTDARADYRVRIFTPTEELPFAGHPTLGSAHAWLAGGGVPRDSQGIVQQCGVGLVQLRRDGTKLAFEAPPLRRSGPLDEADVKRLAALLRVPRTDVVRHQWCDNGPRWAALMLRSADAVLALEPEFDGERNVELGVVGSYPPGSEAAFEVRAFFPSSRGIAEDPVTGSLNAALAQWLIGAGLAPPRYVASQGTRLGCRGRVQLQRDGGSVWVGGAIEICVEGSASL